MTHWTKDKELVAEIVRRYLAGDGCTEIARCFDLTKNQVLGKLARLGHLRHRPALPGEHPPKAPSRTEGDGRRDPRLSKASRVMEALTKGPMSAAEIGQATAMSALNVGRTVWALVHRGLIEREGRRGLSVYRLRADGVPFEPILARSSLRKIEDVYAKARRDGQTADALVADMGLTQTGAHELEKAFRLHTTSGVTRDNTVPKFAHHDRHLAAIGRGFPTCSERRDVQGHAAACLPIRWPEARA